MFPLVWGAAKIRGASRQSGGIAADHSMDVKATASTGYAARLGSHARLVLGRLHGHRANCLPIIRQLAPSGATSRGADRMNDFDQSYLEFQAVEQARHSAEGWLVAFEAALV